MAVPPPVAAVELTGVITRIPQGLDWCVTLGRSAICKLVSLVGTRVRLHMERRDIVTSTVRLPVLERLGIATHVYYTPIQSNVHTASRVRDHTSNWNSSISPWTSNFKIRSSSLSFNDRLVGFLPARVPDVMPTFLVALDGGRAATPLLVVDELPTVVFGLRSGIRGFIGLTCDIVALDMTCFLGEIAFAVALDLTGRAVTAGLVKAVGRDVVAGRVVAVLVVAVTVPTVPVDRVGLVFEVAVVREMEATVGRILVVPGL